MPKRDGNTPHVEIELGCTGLCRCCGRVAQLVAGLNSIASWREGPEVTGSFDEPSSALQARNTLAAAGITQEQR